MIGGTSVISVVAVLIFISVVFVVVGVALLRVVIGIEAAAVLFVVGVGVSLFDGVSLFFGLWISSVGRVCVGGGLENEIKTTRYA